MVILCKMFSYLIRTSIFNLIDFPGWKEVLEVLTLTKFYLSFRNLFSSFIGTF